MALPIEVGPNPNSLATVGTILALGDVGYLGTIGTLMSGGGGSSASQYIGTIAYIGTIGTLESGNVTASVQSGIMQYIATIGTILASSPSGTIIFGTVAVSGQLSDVATVGTILSPVQVVETGTIATIQSGNVTASVSGGILQYLGTVGTLQFANATATVSGGQLADVGTVGTLISGQVTASISGGNIPVIGTILVQSYIGTIGTIISGQVTASISTGQLTDVATIGTILSGNVSVGYIGTIGGITNPVIAIQAYQRSTILANVSVTTSGAGTLTCATLQDMVVDVVYGTVITGSVLTSVVGVEPTRSIQTGTLTQGVWFAGTVQGAERLIVLGPLGELVAVKYTAATAGTLSAGTIMNVTVMAEQSTTG